MEFAPVVGVEPVARSVEGMLEMRELNWLPKCNPGTNRRLEKPCGAVFSSMLTARGDFEGEDSSRDHGFRLDLFLSIDLLRRNSQQKWQWENHSHSAGHEHCTIAQAEPLPERSDK